MKKILAIAAAAALTAGVSAYAANPFSDVSTDDWAYQAVADLSDQGVVIGYPDGTFRGERNITRYELAQIVARMMAREDQLNAEQRAMLEKLAGEYADELANLGVRVSKLEKKVGNLYWSGDARMRYSDKAFGSDSWDGRVRINVKAQAAENTFVKGRLAANMNFKDDATSEVQADQIYIDHRFGDAAEVRLGRYPLKFGNQGGWLYNAGNGFDGAEVQFGLGKFGVSVGFGQFNTSDYKAYVTSEDYLYAQGHANFGAVKLNLDYIRCTDENADEIMGAGLVIPASKDFRIFGEYWTNTTYMNDNDTAWNAGVGFGKMDLKKPGSFAIDVAYNDVDRGVYFGGTGTQTDVLKNLTKRGASNVTYWNALADVALDKNLYLHGEYAFDVDAEGFADSEDAWTVSLNYKF